MATEDRIEGTLFTTPSDNELVATRVVDAPRARVWDAFTRPHEVSRWMLGPDGWTMPVCEIDLREGGEWHFGWRAADGTLMEMRGTYREISPPVRLVQTESWGPPWPDTLNTMVLTEVAGRTDITCTVRYPSREARDAAVATGMKAGWAHSYRLLDRLLAPAD